MEFIQTIQGEGINIGKPVIIVRFDSCDLRCKWCDTKRASLSKEETDYVAIKNQINNLKKNYPNIETLLITGGEPLYNKHFMDVLKTQQDMNFEVETNGTLLENLFEDLRNFYYFEEKLQLNISPKFDISSYNNSEDYKHICSIEQIYSIYKKQFKIMQNTGFDNYTVKFVYGKYLNDCDNIILSFIIMNNIPKEKVCIMPFTPNQNDFDHPRNFLDAFNVSAKQSIEFCLKYGFRYSPREHITLNIK